jgi:plastocyanin
MKTNAQTGKNQPTRYRDARCSSRRLCLSWLATLLLATSGTATAATVTVHVGAGGLFFDPDNVTISTGDTVEWIWDDASKGHSATSGANGTRDGLFDSGIHPAPFTFSFTFPNAGTFPYFCIPHYSMGMVGQIIVTQATSTPTPAPTPTPTSTPPPPTPTPAPTPRPATLGNIATRLQVGTGANVMIAGFVVQGSAPKRVLMRAIGPSLANFGVPNPLANPQLELHDTSSTIGMNDDWQTTQIGGVITADQVGEIQASGLAPSNSLESAIIATLSPGSYTAIVQGVNGGTGVGSVEVYDLGATSASLLANISTRGFVQTGGNVMIGGFIVVTQPTRVIIRAIGPSLSQFGVPDALANPQLELHDSKSVIAQNDDWQTTQLGGIITSDQVAEIQNSQLAPSNAAEAAIIATLPPGSYTAIVSGVNSTTGNALVEVYSLQ